MQTYFDRVDRVRSARPKTNNLLVLRRYNPDEIALGKRMADHLRLTAYRWRSFCWNSTDMLGVSSFERPWQTASDVPEMVKHGADVVFEFFYKLSAPYYCFHDVDVPPEGISLKECLHSSAIVTEVLAEKQQQTGVKLLWGIANYLTHPYYGAGAATSPDPEVFAWVATQVVIATSTTHQLGGENYALWGGREGYKSLLNTDLRQERGQADRFLRMMMERKCKTSSGSMLSIGPKPQELTKHQYDCDVATVYGFPRQFGLENEIGVNIEANRVTLVRHSFHHEIASAIALGIFGLAGANRGNVQLG